MGLQRNEIETKLRKPGQQIWVERGIYKTEGKRGIRYGISYRKGSRRYQEIVGGSLAGARKKLAKVRADKQREARAGYDGTWVAHPGLEPIARAEFDAVMEGENQLERLRDDVHVTAEDLVRPPQGSISENGLRSNIRITLLYLASWLGGNGCVPIDNLMEDAATAEISRAQLWQWVRHPEAQLDSGIEINNPMYRAARAQIVDELVEQSEGEFSSQLIKAAELLDDLVLDDEFATFLTLKAYEVIS